MAEQPEEVRRQALAGNAERNSGIVYVLTNQSMEGYLKIGVTSGNSTRDVLNRMRQLDTTSVPRAFDCEYAAVVENYQQVEQALLVAFGENRVRSNREFLEGIPPLRVQAILKLLEITNVTPQPSDDEGTDAGAVERSARAKPFRFTMAQIPVGARLEWTDNREITCRVVSDSHVEYEGEQYSPSRLTAILKNWRNAKYASPGPYWIYEEETLQERRDRLESQAAESGV